MKRLVANVKSKLLGLQTEDYQNRGGNYPRSGIPDSIEVNERENMVDLMFLFKNTSEGKAENWVSNKLKSLGVYEFNIDSAQEGDYDDDWVEVYVSVKIEEEKKEELPFETLKKCLMEVLSIEGLELKPEYAGDSEIESIFEYISFGDDITTENYKELIENWVEDTNMNYKNEYFK